MLAEIRGSCKQNREFANIAQKCFQNLANKKSVWSLCKVVQTKKTSHKVRGVLLREGLYKAFASCLSSAAVSGFLSSSSIFAASLSSLSVTAVLAAASALTVSIPREGWQSIRIWEYCPFSVSRYCRRMVSRLIAFTRDTSIPDSWMSAGIRSTPSGWCRIPSPGRIGSSIKIRPIASDSVKGSLSG